MAFQPWVTTIMSDWIEFEGRIEPMEWGRATYTILPVPDPVVAALGATRRVELEINDQPANLALTRAPAFPGVFLWTGASLLARLGVSPGTLLDVRLRPAPDDAIDLDPDIEAALMAAGVWAQWEALTAGKKRGLLYQIATAKTGPTRQKRIARLAESLG